MGSEKLTPRMIHLLIESKNGESFTRDQIGYNRTSWYLDTGFLKSRLLIVENGLNDRHQIEWKLTERGIELAQKLFEISQLYGVINKELKNNGKRYSIRF